MAEQGIVLAGAVEGDLQLSRVLLTGSVELNNLRRPLGLARQQLLSSTQLNFGAVGGLMGGWKPRKQVYSWPLLQKTGRMRGNFQSKVDPNRMEIWNPTFYFKFHQSNRARKSNLPRRVMLKIIAQDKRRIQKFFQEHVQNALKGRSR
jgi:phage gpG-like protein